MLKAVTLDFWGTLIDDRRSGSEARVDVLLNLLPGLSRERAAAAYATAWSRFLEAGSYGWGLPPASILSMALDELGATLRPPAYDAALSAWEQAHLLQQPRLVPGVREMLISLRQRGLLVGLISDTGATPGAVYREYMAVQGIRTLFDWLSFSNEIGVTKRQPQAFRLTLAALGVSPAETVHVGDTPATDILGAQAAGLRAGLTIEVHDRRAGNPCQPHFVLERLCDLPAALDGL